MVAMPRQLRDWGLMNVYDIYPGIVMRQCHAQRRACIRSGTCQGPAAVTLSPSEHIAWQWLPYRDAADTLFFAFNAEAVCCCRGS